MFSAVRVAPAARSATRPFSTSQKALDVSKVTLVGRLGADPVVRESSQGKPFVTYAVATRAPSTKDASGHYQDGPTSWHNVFAFNELTHPNLLRAGKGSTVYVEAELDMKKSDPIEGKNVHDRALLRQISFRVINRTKPESEEGEASE